MMDIHTLAQGSPPLARLRTGASRVAGVGCRGALMVCSCGVAGAVLFAALAGAALADVHDNRGWFVGGHTYAHNSDKREDPITTIFKGTKWGLPLQENSGGMISKWGQGPGGTSRGEMHSIDSTLCASNQDLFFHRPETRVENTWNTKTRCYKHVGAWHIRAWDSDKHDQVHHPPGDPERGTWAMVGVHRDAGILGDHPTTSWEIAAGTLRHELAEYCSWKDWRRLPGSIGKFQGYYSDGILSRISPERIDAFPGKCG